MLAGVSQRLDDYLSRYEPTVKKGMTQGESGVKMPVWSVTSRIVGLDERALLYVLDVHQDDLISEEEQQIAVPAWTHAQGRTPTTRRADREPIRLDRYGVKLSRAAWDLVTIRKGEKGWLKRRVHGATVWRWDGEEDHARRRTLVISKTPGRAPKTTYSLSNGRLEDYAGQEYAYFQAQRYWVERCFDDVKNERGLSDYQVRKWQVCFCSTSASHSTKRSRS